MKTMRIQLEYKCYPVWLYDEEGFVEDTALPAELAKDFELDEKFRSIQARFDATYIDTRTDFYNMGFASKEEETAFEADLKAAINELSAKCPQAYLFEVDSALGV